MKKGNECDFVACGFKLLVCRHCGLAHISRHEGLNLLPELADWPGGALFPILQGLEAYPILDRWLFQGNVFFKSI